jgi:hypothetical protein
MSLRDGNDVGIGINGVERRCGIHPGEDPRGAVSRSRTEFEEAPTWLRSRERRQQRTDLGLRHHVEGHGFCVRDDAAKGHGLAANLGVIHDFRRE